MSHPAPSFYQEGAWPSLAKGFNPDFQLISDRVRSRRQILCQLERCFFHGTSLLSSGSWSLPPVQLDPWHTPSTYTLKHTTLHPREEAALLQPTLPSMSCQPWDNHTKDNMRHARQTVLQCVYINIFIHIYINAHCLMAHSPRRTATELFVESVYCYSFDL
jgi:hypothetical protein